MPGYTEREAREALAVFFSYAETLRRLGLRAAGGNAPFCGVARALAHLD
jgi:hypothetical protein